MDFDTPLDKVPNCYWFFVCLSGSLVQGLVLGYQVLEEGRLRESETTPYRRTGSLVILYSVHLYMYTLHML